MPLFTVANPQQRNDLPSYVCPQNDRKTNQPDVLATDHMNSVLHYFAVNKRVVATRTHVLGPKHLELVRDDFGGHI